MVAHEGRLYVIGGWKQDSREIYRQDLMEVYDPEENKWTVSSSKLSCKRRFIGAAVINLQTYD